MRRIFVPILAAMLIVTAFTACQPENEVKPFEWDITASLARHENGDTADHGNWKAVSSLTLRDNVIEIEADSSMMEEYLSSDPSQQETAQKWFAILIGTGDPDIRNISFNNVKLTDKDVADRDDMLKTNGTPAGEDEFVLWLNAENADGYRIMLTRENASAMTLSVKFTDSETPAEELPEANIPAINGIAKAAFLAFETLETGTKIFDTDEYSGTADLSVEGDDWTMHVTADHKAKAPDHDIEFTITNTALAAGDPMEVTIAGTTYTTPSDGIMSGVEIPEPPAPYEAPANEDVKAELEAFFAEFGRIQGWDHGTHSEPLYIDSEDLEGSSGWNDGVSAYINFGRYPETVGSIKMLGTDFTADTEMQVSIGSNVFYRDRGWKTDEDGNLLVNKLFMFASLMFDEGFNINGKDLGYDLGYDASEALDTGNWWDMDAQENRYAAIEEIGNGEYDVTVSTMNKPLYSSYSGQSDDDVILAVTDYTENGNTTRQLALLTGEKNQFISYFYGWRDTYEESVEKLMTVNDRDVEDRAVVLASDGTIKGTYGNTYHVSSAYISAEELPTIYGYFEFPAHERIFNRINGVEDETFTVSSHTYENGKLTVTMSADGFEYQKEGVAGLTGVEESHIVTGDLVFTFTGTADADVFRADSWTISTDDLLIDGGHEFVTEGFSGKISTDGALGTTAGTADFGIAGGDWDGTVKNPADASFSFALGIEGSAAIDDKVLLASMFSNLLG